MIELQPVMNQNLINIPMKTKRTTLIILITLISGFMVIIQTGCKKDTDNDPAPPQITNVNGSWSGKTSQNENVSFTIESNVVKTFFIKLITPVYILEITIYSTLPTVTNNSFSFSSTVSTGTLYITGNFTSNTTAEGTFKLNSTEGTWTATR